MEFLMTSIMMIIKYFAIVCLGVRTWCISQCHETQDSSSRSRSLMSFLVSLCTWTYFKSLRAAGAAKGDHYRFFFKYWELSEVSLSDTYLNCLRLNWRSMMSKDHLPKDPWSVVKIWLEKNGTNTDSRHLTRTGLDLSSYLKTCYIVR